MSASARFLDSDGYTLVNAQNWPDAFANANQMPRKFAVENNGDRVLGSSPGPATGLQLAIEQVGTNDGSSMLRTVADTATLSPPYGLSTALSAPGAGGVWGATGTYGYVVSAINATGETIACVVEATAVVAATTQKVTLTWTQVAGATGYKVYRTATAGTYGASTLRATTGATGTYVDDGTATGAGTPATKNTTGDWLPTDVVAGGGAFAAGTYYWTVAAYDSSGVLIAISREISDTVVLNDKVTVSWSAVDGASTYSLFRSTGSGVYATPALVASGIAGTSQVDTGAALSAGGLTNPLSSTLQTFGFAPSGFQSDALTVFSGSLPVGAQWFFWVNRVIPGATPEAGNPRNGLTTLQEV